MKVSLIQTDIKWSDVQYNINNVRELIRNSPQSDLYILPEMFTTGFNVNPHEISEDEGGVGLQLMKSLAAEFDAAIAGSIAVHAENDSYYNRFYFVTPDGFVSHYDKCHLFSYGDENKKYSPGRERMVVVWRGVRFMLQVCYDLRFPVFSRNRTPYYDCLIYVANWPESRRKVWDILLQARAIENQCYVLGVNRVGDDPSCHYNGGTSIIDAYGRYVSKAADNKEEAISLDLDMEKLAYFRNKFNVLADQY